MQLTTTAWKAGQRQPEGMKNTIRGHVAVEARPDRGAVV
jgi:hypothetical protein